MLPKCNLCGFFCNIERSKKSGACKIDDGIYISYYGLHHGEEPFLVGKGGSGTIFFLGCNLRCQFCQNFQISRWENKKRISGTEKKVTIEELVKIFFELKEQGAVNINFVSPTPYVYQIAEAVKTAKEKKIDLPFVYNTHGYDSQEALKLLDGIIDIYLPDAKYADDQIAFKYSGVKNYTSINQNAIREMYRQVGQLEIDARGMGLKGLAVRHLVLPNNLDNSLKVLDFLASFGSEISISLMSQYHPVAKLEINSELQRTLSKTEYEQVVRYAQDLGLENCLIQEMDSHDNYLPDFEKGHRAFNK